MESEISTCPLITPYAVAAVSHELLEKLYLVRKWPIDPDHNPIPFKQPKFLRGTIYDTVNDMDSGVPLIIKEFQKQSIIHLARMPRFFFLAKPSDWGKLALV